MSAEVDLTDIRVLELPTIDLSGGVDLGLDLDNIRIRSLPRSVLVSPTCRHSI